MSDIVLDTLFYLVVVVIGLVLSYITYKLMIRKERDG